MFKISNENSYYWPVKIRYPDNGSFKEHTVMIKLKHLSYDEERLLTEQASEALTGLNDETKIQKMGDLSDYETKVIDTVFLGWKEGEIKDSDNNNLEDTPENIALMLKSPAFRRAILDARRKSASEGKLEI